MTYFPQTNHVPSLKQRIVRDEAILYQIRGLVFYILLYSDKRSPYKDPGSQPVQMRS